MTCVCVCRGGYVVCLPWILRKTHDSMVVVTLRVAVDLSNETLQNDGKVEMLLVVSNLADNRI